MQLGCNRRVGVVMVDDGGLASGAPSAQSGQRNVGRVQLEAMQRSHAFGDSYQQIRRQVDDGATLSTLGMQMRPQVSGEVIGGGAVPQVHMLNHSQLTERRQSPIHTGAVNFRCNLGDRGGDLLGAEMAGCGGQRSQDGPPRSTHALAFGTQLGCHRVQQQLSVGCRTGL